MIRRLRKFILISGTLLSLLIAAAYVLSGLRVPLVCGSRTPPKIGFSPSIWPAYPFAAVAVATLLVWRFGPKPVEPGHCRCGYDLKGNVSGVCPECGARA